LFLITLFWFSTKVLNSLISVVCCLLFNGAKIIFQLNIFQNLILVRPGPDPIKLFGIICIKIGVNPQEVDRGYTSVNVNYANKCFVGLGPGSNVTQLVFFKVSALANYGAAFVCYVHFQLMLGILPLELVTAR
jgi:hypothetical protein